MEKKVKQEPVYETKHIQTGTKDIEVFIAKGGKEFKTEKECLDYEERLDKLAEGKGLFIDANFFTNEQDESVLKLCFDAYNDIEDIKMLIWKATNDKVKKQEALEYLRLMYFNNIFDGFLDDFNEGEYVVIASWTQDSNSDRPTYKGKRVLLKEILTELQKLKDNFENLIKQ